MQKRLYKKAESYPLTDDSLLFCLCSCAFLRRSNGVIPPNRLYGPKDFFTGPFLICGDGGEDLISLTDSQITKYEKKYHSPLIFLELYPEPITFKCTPELYAKWWERNISMMHRKMSAMRDKSICMENRENGLCSYWKAWYTILTLYWCKESSDGRHRTVCS